jgi:ATP-dependent DNA ligase
MSSDEPLNDKDYFATEKIDGAHYLAELTPRGISFTSQRKSVKGALIERENNVPHLRDLKAPNKYDGFVLRGELWHDKGFNTVSGILNSKPPRAVETQKQVGLVQFAPFRIHKGPHGEENLPYEEQYKIIKDISANFPHYFEPPRVADKPHKDFFEEIGRERGEGVVLVHKQTGESYKMKHRYDYDLKVDGFTPGTGKYEGRAVGAINLKDKAGRSVGKVGTGLTDEQRIDMHKNPDKYIGKLVKVESRKPLIGQLREPSFLGFTTDKNEPDEVV